MRANYNWALPKRISNPRHFLQPNTALAHGLPYNKTGVRPKSSGGTPHPSPEVCYAALSRGLSPWLPRQCERSRPSFRRCVRQTPISGRRTSERPVSLCSRFLQGWLSGHSRRGNWAGHGPQKAITHANSVQKMPMPSAFAYPRIVVSWTGLR